MASCVFQLAASTRSRTLELVGIPYNNNTSTNVSYDEIKASVPENSKKTFDQFRKTYGSLTSRVNPKSLLEFIIDTMLTTPVLISSNFGSLFSLRKHRILNSIISFENLGKLCIFENCEEIASVVIYDKVKDLKIIYCIRHAKKIVAISGIFNESNDSFTIKLYHPYLVSITCGMDYLIGSLYRLDLSVYQHENEISENIKLKSLNSNYSSSSSDYSWEPIFRLDIERNESYLTSGQKKVHCINGVRRYVNDCCHSELNSNPHTFGSVASVMGTKCVINSLKDSDYYYL